MYKLLCGFLLLFCLQTKAQSKDSLNVKLTEAKREILANVVFNDNANKAFDVLTQKATEAYQRDGSSKNLAKILEHYRTLLTEIKGVQTPKANNTEEFEVSYESIKKAKLKLCPLYPFCD
jgi:flagellar motility protein MotE (MotC chaperone)